MAGNRFLVERRSTGTAHFMIPSPPEKTNHPGIGCSAQYFYHGGRSKSSDVTRNQETASRLAAAPLSENWPNAGYRSPPPSQLKTTSPE